MRWLAIALTAVVSMPARGGAQSRAPADGGITVSLGQPRLLKWTTGAAAGWRFGSSDNAETVEARLGAYGDPLNPLYGIASIHGEGYASVRGSALDGGVRLRMVNSSMRFGVGADYNARDGRARLLLSMYHPGRRGGLFREGSLIRLDYEPGRSQQVSIGVETPIMRRIPTGKTRPLLDHVPLARAAAPAVSVPRAALGLDEPLAHVRDAAQWIRRANVPFLSYDGSARSAAAALARELSALKRDLHTDASGGVGRRRTMDAEVRRFHAELERAFSIAVSGQTMLAGTSTPDGRRLAAHSRAILLAEVLLPYDRLLGQVKKPDGIDGFASRARGIFVRRMYTDPAVPHAATDAVLWVFASVIAVIDENHAAARAEWRDSRFVWLPLQYALLPEDHDTQSELDALIEQAVGHEFTEGNSVQYVINEQFQYQLSRTVREAEDYHVLWTHDFRGYDDKGDPDEMSYAHVLRTYLAALTERVRAYDSAGTFPAYMIFLDEWFYQVRRGRLWMNLLEDPTRHRLRLPAGFGAWEDSIAAAQDSLRAAIAASRLLQAQRMQYGERWLLNLVKVHVNITNAADPSFWSRGVARGVSLPDNMMRDHRKMVFYDLTEDDPYRGEAMFTGAGIGEHYANKSWEDRSLLVRGPAVLGLKAVARNALLQQGIDEGSIPHALQPRAKAHDYDARVRSVMERDERPLRAIQMHNATGFGEKQVNVAKAVLYTLMPPGSVIKIPDSLWNDAFWGSAMLGCALRGVRVLIIAPSYANHPVDATGSRLLGRELLVRLLAAEHAFAAEIAEAGGLLKLGVYAPEFEVTDIAAKVRSVELTLGRHAWLRDLFDFPPGAYAELHELANDLSARLSGQTTAAVPARNAAEFEYDPRPKLHLKANFFASREAWRLMARPEWPTTAYAFTLQRLAEARAHPDIVKNFANVPKPAVEPGSGMVENWFASLDAGTRERVVFYTMMGSQNQNFRSMVVDGEDAFVVANWPSTIAYLDLISLVGACRWVEDRSELDALLPPVGALMTRLAHWFILAF